MSEAPSERYSRQTRLPEIGLIGQDRLNKARVLCVGAGGLGSPALLYLAAAGVGTLGIIDDDSVSESNLHRQVLFGTSDLGKNKALAARERLLQLNSTLTIHAYPERLHSLNAEALIAQYDLVLDGSDLFETKFLINDFCYRLGKPWVFASIQQFEGQLAVFHSTQGPCYRCLVPSTPEIAAPNCAESGILGAHAGWVGTAQALEAIKLIVQNPALKALQNQLAVFDGTDLSIRHFDLNQRSDCMICNSSPGQIRWEGTDPTTITPQELSSLIQSDSPVVILDLREDMSEELDDAIVLHWPFAKIQKSVFPVDQEQEYVLACERGKNSEQALSLLRRAGFKSVKHLRGGFSAWNDHKGRGL